MDLSGAGTVTDVYEMLRLGRVPPTTTRRECMASRSKKKTTMAKHNRENAVRERRLRKQLKKEARKAAAAAEAAGVTSEPSDTPPGDDPAGDAR
jgi:hypothetical protein